MAEKGGGSRLVKHPAGRFGNDSRPRFSNQLQNNQDCSDAVAHCQSRTGIRAFLAFRYIASFKRKDRESFSGCMTDGQLLETVVISLARRINVPLITNIVSRGRQPSDSLVISSEG